jgi:hypothetical protein
VFRPSVYRVCLRLLHAWYDSRELPRTGRSPELTLVTLLRDEKNRPWRREGVEKPNPREALMAARVYVQCRSARRRGSSMEGIQTNDAGPSLSTATGTWEGPARGAGGQAHPDPKAGAWPSAADEAGGDSEPMAVKGGASKPPENPALRSAPSTPRQPGHASGPGARS